MTLVFNKGSQILLKNNYFKIFNSRFPKLFQTHYQPLNSNIQIFPFLQNELFSTYKQCSLCGTVNPSLRTIYTTHINNKKKKERKPLVYNKKSKTKVVPIWKNMTLQELANNMEKTLDEMFEIFLYVEGTESLDRPSAIISDLRVIQHSVKLAGKKFVLRAPEVNVEELFIKKDAFKSPPAPPEDLMPRPPIVTIMGHVDHGKTTLLDTLRQSAIVDTEFGGITQHIGAFEVSLPSGEQVTFLDTPGHAAFSAMRSRGAMVTDLIVLVVAADDGVLPQTEESLQLARETATPLVVAINKIDKAEADVKRVKDMLLEAGLQLEEQGGEVQAVEVSALKGTNVPLLVEALVTQAELLHLRATKKGLAEGAVVEAKMDPRRGKIATCIVQRGTLTRGAFLVAETSWAKVRNLFDCSGQPIEKALPGTPVQVIGWRDSLPSAGAELLEVESEKRAREVVSLREDERKRQKGLEDKEVIQKKVEDHTKEYKEQLEKKRQLGIRFKMYRGRPPLEKQFKEDPRPRVNLVLKGDVDGSIEAILDVLETYHSEEVPLDVLSYGVGEVNPNDVEMAKAFKGSIYTFNVAVSKEMRQLARKNGVPLEENNIIYRLVDKLKEEISKRLPLKPVEEIIGEANVQQEFLVSEGKKKKIPVAGCLCVKGQLKKNASFRVVRSQNVIHEGPVESLRHIKKEVDSIKKDVECGIRLQDVDVRFQPGDQLVCYRVNMTQQQTDWSPDGF